MRTKSLREPAPVMRLSSHSAVLGQSSFRNPQLLHACFLLLLGAAACAPAMAPGISGLTDRPIPHPPFESTEFTRAVERGTRTHTGEPGPNYWQQYAQYSLAAELNPVTTHLSGSGQVRYHNRSPDSLDRVVVHLYQNLHAPNAERNEPVPVTGGIHVSRVVADGVPLSRLDSVGGAGYRVTGTIATLYLPRAIASGGSTLLEFDWSFRVPPTGAPRMGQDGEVFHVAFWYPQVAVYDDLGGWDTEQYRGNGEFYMGYADYDVSLRLPAGWIVSATGELVNANEVLTPGVRARIAQARATDSVIAVVAADQRRAGASTAAGSRLTWRYTARNVRDFAWNASNRYVWDATRALIPSPAGAAPDTVLIHALYRPGATQREHWARFGRHSIEFPSRKLWPYPYPHMTYVEGLIGGGMEFPMITLIGRPQLPTELSLHSVTIHETIHMWFPMLVGSNERRYAWMDEGLARFIQLDGMQELFPDIPRDSLRRDTYIPLARQRREVESMRHADLFPPGSSFGVASYDKPAKMLHALRAIIGEETLWRSLREYGRRWENRHPQPWDLFNTVEQVSGRRLGWFWRTWLYETWTLDQAIGAVAPAGRNLTVTIDDRGLAPMPVRLAVTRANGTVERMNIPVDVWLAGQRSHTITVRDAATVRALEIDPEGFFPDVDRSNQRWAADKSR